MSIGTAIGLGLLFVVFVCFLVCVAAHVEGEITDDPGWPDSKF